MVRENTEGVLWRRRRSFQKGHALDEVAIQEDINTRKGVERIIRFAFTLARESGRKKVWMSDKSNAMTHAGGLWQRGVFKLVAQDFPEIETRAYVYRRAVHRRWCATRNLST